ncbi:hypothetical protein [Gordonia sp. (in: high G+C Gram-positive bacteria)]|uniref:DUF7233 domain-containing protein n=1 Tax=Gordonia sp. (in: high G+C Gram-positive bacteria) TaxID=84139 RepID=UPI003C749D1F
MRTRFTTTVRAPGTLIVPLDTSLIAAQTAGSAVVLTVDVDYDYAPFEDPGSPAFDFLADVIRIDAAHMITLDRAVSCTSNPGRTTTEKDT